MTIEKVKLENGKIGVYRRCKKTLGSKIPNISHLTQRERFWFLKHFYKDFANNTNRAYEKRYLFDRENLVNAALIFTAILFIWNICIEDDVVYGMYSLFTGLILMFIVLFLPIPSLGDPRDAFFKLNDVPDWKEFELEYKESGEMIPEDRVGTDALQVTEEEYRYLKAIDALDGRWYEGLVEIESLKKALEHAAKFAKNERITDVDPVEDK